MPPRRARSKTADTPNKRQQKGAFAVPASVPEKPQTDTYTPPGKTVEKTRELITSALKRVRGAITGNHQVKVCVSNTEGSIVTEAVPRIQEESGTFLVVSDATEGSIDRDITVTGTHKSITLAICHISTTLREAVDLKFQPSEVTLNTTLLVPAPAISRMEWVQEDRSIDVSDEHVPFSNFTTIFVSSTINQFVSTVFNLVSGIASYYSQENDDHIIAPYYKVPIISAHIAQERSEDNQKQLERSQASYARYMKQEPVPEEEERAEEKQDPIKEDPLSRSQRQIREAMELCQTKLKKIESMKTLVDVPVDYVSAIIGKGGSKINEMRGRSGCNVNVGDVANMGFRTVAITGLPEGNYIALQYLATIVQ